METRSNYPAHQKDAKDSYVSIAYSYSEKPKTRYPHQFARHLTHGLVGITEGTVVDVGCGRGDQVAALEDLGFRAIGLDRDPPAEKLTEHHRCDLSVDRFPLDDNVADLVISKSVIEHFYFFQLEHYFSEMKRVTKPGGIVLISTPDWKYCMSTFYNAYTHCTPYADRSLRQCLKIHGLTDIQTHSLIPLPSTWKSPLIKVLSDLTLHSPFPHSWGKWFRWSKERQLLGWGRVNK